MKSKNILVSLGVSHQETRSDLRGHVETSVSDYEYIYMHIVVFGVFWFCDLHVNTISYIKNAGNASWILWLVNTSSRFEETCSVRII